MSITSMAMPGGIKTFGGGASAVTPENLFKSEAERQRYKSILDSGNNGNLAPDVVVKNVRVKIFDLSDKKQVEEYERLWVELLEKTAKGEVIVDSRKDLVNRKDGTSYWMKYVEYVEFGDAKQEEKSDRKELK